MSASKTDFKTIFRATIRNTVLLANIFFVLLYVLGVLSTIVSPQSLLYISYFGLFFPFIVAVNIFFIVFWMIKRRRYWLISLCLIVCTFYHANNVFTIPFGRLSKKSYNTEVKLLSYNISSLSGVKKFDDFIDFIDSVSPDIVCFQEFGFYQNDRNKNRLKNAMKKRFPFSHIWYKNQTKNYSWGVATFSKYPIIKKKKIDYESLYNISIYSDIVINSDTIRLINNHLESNKFTLSDIKQYRSLDDNLSSDNIKNISALLSRKMSKAYKIRASQAIIVRKEIDQSPYKTVVCGDFNDVVESYVYHKIKGNLRDVFTATSWGYRYSFRKNYMFVGIDHILIDKDLIPISLHIEPKTFSDHYPLIGIWGIKQTKRQAEEG